MNGSNNERETFPELGNQGRLKEGGWVSLVVFLLVEEICWIPLKQCKNNLEVTSGWSKLQWHIKELYTSIHL